MSINRTMFAWILRFIDARAPAAVNGGFAERQAEEGPAAVGNAGADDMEVAADAELRATLPVWVGRKEAQPPQAR
jgi:hypothetical protein